MEQKQQIKLTPAQKKETVLEILKTQLGDARASLSIGETRGRHDTQFFYRLENEAQILGLLGYLRGQPQAAEAFGLDGLWLECDSKKGRDATKKDVIVRVKEYGDTLEIRFFTIDRVLFRRCYGKLVATILPHKDPLLTLYLDADAVVYAVTKSGSGPLRFSWWINKCLRNSNAVRCFTVALLDALAAEHPILKDVSRAIEKSGYFLPPIPFDALLACDQPDDVIKTLFADRQDRLLSTGCGGLDLNAAYYLTCFAYRFDKDSVKQLLAADEKQLLHCIRPQDLYSTPRAERFLTQYYSNIETHQTAEIRDLSTDPDEMFRAMELWNTGELFDPSRYFRIAEAWEIRSTVEQYVAACAETGEPLRLFASYADLKKQTDAFTDKTGEQEAQTDVTVVPENSRFKALAKHLDHYLEHSARWLTARKELLSEGALAACSLPQVMNDECAVFHMDRGWNSYTIVIETVPLSRRFYVADMQNNFDVQSYGRSPRADDYDAVRRAVGIVNASDDEPVSESHETVTLDPFTLFGDLMTEPEDAPF